MSVGYTPMLEQYRAIKQQHADEILFFRLGDFYEMFFDDALLASKELEITLTSRDGGQDQRIPMCGVPYHAAESYIAKLISKGYKVAICEQVEDPKQAKGLVRREVIKIITPGTVISETLLPDANNNFLAVLYEEADCLVLGAADISTGECIWAQAAGPNRMNAICDHLIRLLPSELLIVGKISDLSLLKNFLASRLPNCLCSPFSIDDIEKIRQLPRQHFEDLPDNHLCLTVIGCLLHYLHTTLKADLSHLNRLTEYTANDYLILDAATLRNLEITRNIRDGSKKDTLFSILDFTQTAMGTRLLKKWLEYPLINHSQIEARQDAIQELLEKPTLRQTIAEQLASVYDFERILTRVEMGSANARDLIGLRTSLAVLPDLKEALLQVNSNLLTKIGAGLDTHSNVTGLLMAAIADDPPISLREGGLIKRGYNAELDELRSFARDNKQWIQDLEAAERERTGIKSLKVGYNKVFGYYIEVTNANLAAVPDNYVRKQTLANAERFITPELKEFETKVLGAQEKIVNLEYYLFTQVRDYVKQHLRQIQVTARLVAELDVLVSLATAAARYGFQRPELNARQEIIIKDGRHPVVERLLKGEMFVPNDTSLNHNDCEIMIITGPNMAGKSTYMRQVALLVLMTQVGSFIPAAKASICPVDRIFTRIGASDDLASGQSTFMVEMNEVAQILKYATPRSLIILDEVGRGTSTFDGMSIARAVLEYIHERIKAFTLFATHYHELTALADQHSTIKNFSVAVKERGNNIVFLRRIVPGGADKSYGIHVAQLAGLPKKVLQRAQSLLDELEQANPVPSKPLSPTATEAAATMNLFTSTIIDELLALDIMTLTPLEALNILYRLQMQAKREAGRP